MSAGVPCPACGDAGTRGSFGKNGYSHRECGVCGSLFVDPAPGPEVIEAFYREQAARHGPVSAICWESDRSHCLPVWRWALEQVRQRSGEGPLLDVGCGTGQFIELAQREGWKELQGMELAGEVARLARERTGVEILETPLEAGGLEAGRYAAVAMWDVIEHLADVRGVIDEVRRVLRPGGLLLLSTPHRNGLSVRCFGARARVIMPPEHLTYFTTGGMRRFLERVGLEPVAVRTLDIYLREWTSAWKREESVAAVHEAYQRRYKAVTRGPLFFGALRVCNMFLETSGLGDQLVAVGQKPRV